MSDTAKQRIAGTVCVFSAFIAVFCISRMIPYGLAGDTGKVKLWFVPAILALVVSIPCAVAYYFYGTRAKDETIKRLHTETDILAQAGRKPTPPTLAYPELNQPKEKSKNVNS